MVFQKHDDNSHDITTRNEIKNEDKLQSIEENYNAKLEICARDYKLLKDLKKFNNCSLKIFRDSIKSLNEMYEEIHPSTSSPDDVLSLTLTTIIPKNITSFETCIDKNDTEIIQTQYTKILQEIIKKNQKSTKNKNILKHAENNNKIKLELCTNNYKKTKDIDEFNSCALASFQDSVQLIERHEMAGSGIVPKSSPVAPLPNSANYLNKRKNKLFLYNFVFLYYIIYLI